MAADFRRARRRAIAGGLAAEVLALFTAIAVAAPSGDGPISDEATHTWWAGVDHKSKIRKAPQEGGKVVGKLRFATELGSPEAYVALRRSTDESDVAWLKIRVPKRPNGTTGWVPESALGELQVVHTQLVVERGKLRATLYKKGKRVWRAPIGIGAVGTPTPKGRFYVRERQKLNGAGGSYGAYAFGTSAYSKLTGWPGGGVIGIHGTNEPGLIPGRVSHGCIRVRNGKIRALRKLMPIGTPVLIK